MQNPVVIPAFFRFFSSVPEYLLADIPGYANAVEAVD